MVRQRLTRAISASANAAGVATFLLEYVPTSQFWTITVNIPTAPASAESVATAGGSTYGQWRGSNSWGPLLVGNGEQLIVTTSGLLAGVQYVLQAVGFAQTEGTPDYTYPLAYADTVTTSIEDLFIGSISGVTTYTISVPISPAWRSLWVAVAWANAATDTISVTGDQSTIELQSFQPPYFKNAKDVFYRYPLIAGLDSSVTLTLTSSANFSAWWGADLSDIDIATYSTIAEVLGLTFEAASTGVTYAPYNGLEGAGYTFTTIPAGAATVDATIDVENALGTSWSAATLPTSHAWQVALSGLNAVAVPATASTAAAYSTNGGQTWSAATLPTSQAWQVALSGLNAVAVPNIGTAGTAAAYSTNGGQTWTAATLPTSQEWALALSGLNAVAVPTNASSSSAAAYSTNGGQTWTAATLPAAGYWQVAVSGSVAVAWLYNTASTTAAYSTNGGQTWSAATLPTSHAWQVALSGSVAVAVPLGGASTAAAYSTNGGQTWSAATLPTSQNWAVAASGLNAVAVPATASTAAAYSTNGGQTWSAATLPTSQEWQVALSGLNAVAVPSISTASTAAAYSTNGGQTWSAATLPTSQEWALALSGSTAVAVPTNASSSSAAAYMAPIVPPFPFTISSIGQTSLTTYSSQSITTTGLQTWPFTVTPAIDTSYYLVAATADGAFWSIPAPSGDIVALGSYVSNTAPSPLTNVISVTYQIFTPMAGVDMTITDALGNVVGTISLGTSAGIYTAHLSYAVPSGTVLIASAPEANAYWKIYTWVATNG